MQSCPTRACLHPRICGKGDCYEAPLGHPMEGHVVHVLPCGGQAVLRNNHAFRIIRPIDESKTAHGADCPTRAPIMLSRVAAARGDDLDFAFSRLTV